MLDEERKFLTAIENASESEKHLLIHALEFAKKAHDGQIRKSGDPYVIHVIDVGRVLWEKFHDIPLAIGGLLHDTVEDVEEITMQQIHEDFGDIVGFIVDAASKDEKSFYLYPDVFFEDKIERQLWAGTKDIRALLVKLADRDHNLSTLQHLQAHKQIRIAFETQAIFQPLKEILQYPDILTIEEATTFYTLFYADKTPSEIKMQLLSTYFQFFENDLFQRVYQNTNNIVWEIDNKEIYKRFLESPTFCNNTKILSLGYDGVAFNVSFYFTSAVVFEDKKQSQMKIHSFKQDSYV